jgi:diguanylate cyclase (GGDEF)-like protein/PAS domain S-box-containing protein
MPTIQSLVTAQTQDTPTSEFSVYTREELEAKLENMYRQLTFLEATEQVANIGHYEWDIELGQLLSCSEQYARLFNMTVEQVIKSQSTLAKMLKQVHADDLDAYKEAIGAMRDSKSLDVEYRLVLDDGTIRHVREFAIIIRTEKGTDKGSFGLLQDVSSQVRYERDLEYRDELARQSEEITDIGHFIYDEDEQRYVYLSEGFARIHGYSVDDYMARVNCDADDLADVIDEDRDRVAEEYRYNNENGKGGAIEYRIRRADGVVRWVRELSRAKLITNGRVSESIGVMQDITNRVQREQELVFKEAMATQAEVITHIGYFLYDVATDRHLYMSPGYAQIAGFGVEELRRKIKSGEDYAERICEQDRGRVRELYNSCRDNLDEWEIEYRLQRPDGEFRWVREVGKAHQRKDGRIEQIIGVIQDVTRQKEIEQELLYKDALANQAEAITEIGHFVYDEIREKYLFVSPGFARIVGRNAEEVISRGLDGDEAYSYVHPDDRAAVEKAYDRFLSESTEWQIDYRLIRGDGVTRWVREMGKAHLFSHGIPEQTIGVLQDITEQKGAEQEITRARDTLEQQVVERTRELANTVKQLQVEIEEREKVTAELHLPANHDALTGLPSLRLCKDRLDQSLAEARRNRQTSAVMFLDLDGFKDINDRHGHEFGDRVLKMTAQRIRSDIRETDTVARIGGDEFVIILLSLPECAIANRIATTLIEGIAQPITIDQIEVAISASIGISLYPKNGVTAEELIRSADKAMYQVKHQGKNGFGFVVGDRQD